MLGHSIRYGVGGFFLSLFFYGIYLIYWLSFQLLDSGTFAFEPFWYELRREVFGRDTAEELLFHDLKAIPL